MLVKKKNINCTFVANIADTNRKAPETKNKARMEMFN